MNGYPKFLNTKEDYIYAKENFPAEKWEKDYQELLDGAYGWFNTGEITGDGITDDTHKVVISKTQEWTEDQTETKNQFEYKLNEECKLLRIGFTVEEVKEAIASASSQEEVK